MPDRVRWVRAMERNIREAAEQFDWHQSQDSAGPIDENLLVSVVTPLLVIWTCADEMEQAGYLGAPTTAVVSYVNETWRAWQIHAGSDLTHAAIGATGDFLALYAADLDELATMVARSEPADRESALDALRQLASDRDTLAALFRVFSAAPEVRSYQDHVARLDDALRILAPGLINYLRLTEHEQRIHDVAGVAHSRWWWYPAATFARQMGI